VYTEKPCAACAVLDTSTHMGTENLLQIGRCYSLATLLGAAVVAINTAA
jgi:hypothetical protein